MSEALVVYDGTCGFCRAGVTWLANRFDLKGRRVAWQGTDIHALGLTRRDVTQRMWYVHGSTRHAGAAAFAAWLRTGNRTARVLGYALCLPGVAQLAGCVYWLVARNRHRIPGPWEHTCTI
ncbi:thiol-disulfide oxidoreductase DCC family protein [Streptomyces silvisoli]|uniref:thiol-disulfide oxidoreductase DCC family protein n=1 Tax=Streptomyces silvisoli TaxID=3034235 RepID=UPI0023E11771|nr:DCC1-like thiol-disulfide oxidoreductase family protein [Streptomyces silvisoli]